MNNSAYSILITGASRGIGRSIALAIAGDPNATVIVNYTSAKEQADEVVTAVRAAGSSAIAVKADVSSEAEVRALYDTAEKTAPVRTLINSAGVILYKKVEDTSLEEFRRVMDINVVGTFLTCREAARRMASGGKILNFSTSVCGMMLPTYATYAASKGAVEQLTRHLAKELGPKGIAVNAIAPGPTATDMFLKGKSPQEIEANAQRTAFGRIGKPEEIAQAACMLVSDAAGWVTGQVLRVNGGAI